MKSRNSGKEAVYVARESERRRPVKLLASDRVDGVSVDPLPSETADEGRKAPPRVPKRSRFHDQCMAPTPNLESHRTRLRKASDEFVDVRRTLPCLWWSGVRLRSTAAVRSRANRPCLAAFALLGGLARRPEKGGRRGTQGYGGWEADRNGMKGGPGHGGAEKFLRSTPNPYGP